MHKEGLLEKIFGSRTRVKLFRLFFAFPEQEFFVREISRTIGEQINSVRRELNNLEVLGIVQSESRDKKKFFRVNTDFMLYNELRSLIVKSRVTLEKEFMKSIESLGAIKYLVLAGYFVNNEDAKVDLFIVGKISRAKLDDLLLQFQKQFSQQLRFTVMSPDEYLYRKDVTDKFLYEILNGEKIVLVDTFD